MTQPTQEQLQELIKLYESRNLDEAEVEVKNLLKQFPDNITCLNIYGVILDSKGQPEEAIKVYQQALQINENSAETHFNMGSILHRQGRGNEARISYEKAISIKPDFLNAYFNLGLIYQNLQDNKKAIESFEKAIELKPDFHEAIGALGTAVQAQGELDEAIEYYKKALSIQPDARNHFNLAAGLRTSGSLDEAIEEFKKSLSFNENNPETLTSLGDALWHKGEINEGLDKLNKAVEVQPDHPQANYNLAVFLSDNNELEKALEHFQKAKIFDWQERSLYCLYKTEKYEQFKTELDNIIKNKKNDSPFLATLSSHHAINFKIKDQYNFCINPLEFAAHMSIKELSEPDSPLLKELLQDIQKEEISKRTQSRLHHGTQSSGNLFKRSEGSFKTLAKLISKAIEDYYKKNKDKDKESIFVKQFPKNVDFNSSWYVKMQSGGHLDSHIHEEGWVSGSVYLSIPKEKKDPNEGAIELSLHGDNYPKKHENFPTKTYPVKVGDVVFFPSSVFHRTIPFNSKEERICIAFDVKPQVV
ncbi:MAG: TPR repeat-containing protein YrrB [Alphaproteobacteria bacterium MarineAlpha6_Bin4]|nr:MAG: TPR repeat-containing protein YrrB [Alphaproteobacteria bacterium MarineAlpha6_Bin3]PPR37951.1 MAG: TPR repeat-containing protein YrrB [Alphaproteobacteria bacterium MarineAlpha6_Bin4]|tara:strand:+ start:2968 stop:4560 length:1593 start_codon:yes stop_codon:yes gene_type:complete